MTKTILASALLLAGLAATPAFAVPDAQWPDYPAATYRLDHAGQGADHWPVCTGQMNGTAHHSCGSLTGGPAGGLS